MARLTKGALLQTLPGEAAPRIWVFPFNPEALHQHWVTPELDPAVRGLRHRMSFELVLDATDAFEQGRSDAELDVASQIAVLELLATAPRAASLYFIWGALRVWPVQLLALHVREEAFDAALNVTRAVIAMQLQVDEGRVRGDRMRRLFAGRRDQIRAALAERGLALSAGGFDAAFGGDAPDQ